MIASVILILLVSQPVAWRARRTSPATISATATNSRSDRTRTAAKIRKSFNQESVMPQNIAEFRIIGRIGKITARECIAKCSM